MLVNIAAERVDNDIAVHVARTDDRNLVVEIYPLFGNQRGAAKCFPRIVDVSVLTNHELALAIVAEASRLDDQRQAEILDRIHNVLVGVDRAIACQRDIQLIKEALLVESILGVPQCVGGRVDRYLVLDLAQRLDRHVLKFKSDDIAGCGEFGQRVAVVKWPLNNLATIGCGRCVGRIDETAFDAEVACCVAQHLAELAGSDNANFHGLAARVAIAEHPLGLRSAERVERRSDGLVFVGKDGGGKQRGVDGASTSNSHAANRNAGRHLGYREERVHAV